MNLQIRDPRARKLATELAKRKNISMTEAVIGAPTSELQRIDDAQPLAARLAMIADDLAAQARPGGHAMSCHAIDAMGGHS